MGINRIDEIDLPVLDRFGDVVKVPALEEIVSDRFIACRPVVVDRRIVAICYLDDHDINALMVRFGWAVAYRRYSHRYVDEEDFARTNKLGMWSGTFEMPWEWRKAH